TRTLPVIVSEFGGRNAKDEPWVRQVLQALEDHQWDWTAWDMHPAASPCLIRDWKYTPTPFFGRWVKLALEDRLPRYTPPPAPARGHAQDRLGPGRWRDRAAGDPPDRRRPGDHPGSPRGHRR